MAAAKKTVKHSAATITTTPGSGIWRGNNIVSIMDILLSDIQYDNGILEMIASSMMSKWKLCFNFRTWVLNSDDVEKTFIRNDGTHDWCETYRGGELTKLPDSYQAVLNQYYDVYLSELIME